MEAAALARRQIRRLLGLVLSARPLGCMLGTLIVIRH